MEAKKKELESFFPNQVWLFDDADNAPADRVHKARFILTWKKHENGAPRAKAVLWFKAFEIQMLTLEIFHSVANLDAPLKELHHERGHDDGDDYLHKRHLNSFPSRTQIRPRFQEDHLGENCKRWRTTSWTTWRSWKADETGQAHVWTLWCSPSMVRKGNGENSHHGQRCDCATSTRCLSLPGLRQAHTSTTTWRRRSTTTPGALRHPPGRHLRLLRRERRAHRDPAEEPQGHRQLPWVGDGQRQKRAGILWSLNHQTWCEPLEDPPWEVPDQTEADHLPEGTSRIQQGGDRPREDSPMWTDWWTSMACCSIKPTPTMYGVNPCWPSAKSYDLNSGHSEPMPQVGKAELCCWFGVSPHWPQGGDHLCSILWFIFCIKRWPFKPRRLLPHYGPPRCDDWRRRSLQCHRLEKLEASESFQIDTVCWKPSCWWGIRRPPLCHDVLAFDLEPLAATGWPKDCSATKSAKADCGRKGPLRPLSTEGDPSWKLNRQEDRNWSLGHSRQTSMLRSRKHVGEFRVTILWRPYKG